jgi:predicted dehydrogenase
MRLAIVGCGRIGTKRAAAAKGHEIVMVCDTDPARREGLAAATSARAVADWREAIAADIDAAIIATPHHTLAEIALAAVETGRHVLIEKPGARRAQELRPVVEAAWRRGVVVKVGFNHRFHPAIAQAKALVAAGEIGPIMFIRGRYGHGGRLGYEKEWRFDPQISGGGELIDQGSHLIDLARWFLGDLRVAFGFAPKYFWPGRVDDNCFLALTSVAGQMAWLHASWTEWKNQFSLEIMGRTGKLTVDGLGGSYGVERLIHHRMPPEMGVPETDQWDYPLPDRSFSDEFENFVAAIEQRAPLIGDGHDAVAALELIQSVYEQWTPWS